MVKVAEKKSMATSILKRREYVIGSIVQKHRHNISRKICLATLKKQKENIMAPSTLINPK
jgi:hypothetical protein